MELGPRRFYLFVLLLLPLLLWDVAATNERTVGFQVEASVQSIHLPNATGTTNISASNITANGSAAAHIIWRANLNVTEVQAPEGIVINSTIHIDPLGGWSLGAYENSFIIVFLDLARNATVDGQKDKGGLSCRSGRGLRQRLCSDDFKCWMKNA